MTVSNLRLEINIRRLLQKCELLGRENSSQNDWRLETYVKALNEMVTELQKKTNKPTKDVFNEYNRRIQFLKKLVESKSLENPVERVVAVQFMSHSSTSDNITKEIHQKTVAKFNTDIREQLFRVDKAGQDDLRQRKNEKSTGEDLDALLKYHHSMQEKIAEDMLLLTQNLKQQTQLSSDIIRKDTETMQKSAGLTDHNLSKLKIESDRLEVHNKRAWKCWMWVLIVIVMVVFVNMVLFMKIMKKKS